MKFTEFDLRPELLEVINKVGFVEPTPIQTLVIPQVLRGKDVSGLAQTGTGKTAAFVLPLIDRLLRFRSGDTGEQAPKNWKKSSFVLVLVPTRELAVQVEESVSLFGKDLGMGSCVIVGGSGYDDQRKALRSGVEFVVGTPGRLLDLYKTHDLDLHNVGAIVFDEADRMFDMGFKDDMKFILRRVPRDRQFLLFSATLNFDVVNTAYQFGAEPVEFNVSRDSATAEGIDHEILHVGQDEKPMFLLSILKKMNPEQCIVFSNFKHNVKPIARFLKDNGIGAIEMSSLLSQAQRNKVLEAFKAGSKQILVATDVAARGLDVKGIDLVVNYDLPDDPEGYVHRIGRTGRAGGSGRAVGMVSDRDVEALMRIETYLKEKLKIGWLDDTDLVKEFKPYIKEFVSDGPGGRRPRPPQGGRSGPGPRGPSRGPSRGPQRGPPRDATSGPRSQGNRGRQGPAQPGQPNQPPREHNHPQRASNQAPTARPKTDNQNIPNPAPHSAPHGANAATGGPSSHPRNSSGPQRQNQGQGRGSQRSGSQSQGRNQSHSSQRRRPLRTGSGAEPRRENAKSDSGVGAKIKSFLNKFFK